MGDALRTLLTCGWFAWGGGFAGFPQYIAFLLAVGLHFLLSFGGRNRSATPINIYMYKIRSDIW